MIISRQKLIFALSLPEYKFHSVLLPLPDSTNIIKTDESILVEIGQHFISVVAKNSQAASKVILEHTKKDCNSKILLHGNSWPWPQIKATENIRYQTWEIDLDSFKGDSPAQHKMSEQDCLKLMQERLPESLWVNVTKEKIKEWIDNNQIISSDHGIVRWTSSESGVAQGHFVATTTEAPSDTALILANKTLSAAKNAGSRKFRVFIDVQNATSLIFHQALGFYRLTNFPDMVEWTISNS